MASIGSPEERTQIQSADRDGAESRLEYYVDQTQRRLTTPQRLGPASQAKVIPIHAELKLPLGPHHPVIFGTPDQAPGRHPC
jgi:hypothetical protein